MYSVELLCRLFGVTKQAYYKHNETGVLIKASQEAFVVKYIQDVRSKDRGIGGLKLWYMYQRKFRNNSPVGRDRFGSIVDKYGLKVRQRLRKPKTTDSSHGLPTYPNLIKDFIPTAPNELWVSDITYIPIWQDSSTYNFCYLSLILDAYTEEIIGWSIKETLNTSGPIESLNKALNRLRGKPVSRTIHHSDRGCQYASNDYVNILKRNDISISMTECGNPKDNAQAERINNTMKNELLKDLVFNDIKEVRLSVEAAIEFYNNERPHMSIDMMTPAEASKTVGEIRKRWTSYKLLALRRRRDSVLEVR